MTTLGACAQVLLKLLSRQKQQQHSTINECYDKYRANVAQYNEALKQYRSTITDHYHIEVHLPDQLLSVKTCPTYVLEANTKDITATARILNVFRTALLDTQKICDEINKFSTAVENQSRTLEFTNEDITPRDDTFASTIRHFICSNPPTSSPIFHIDIYEWVKQHQHQHQNGYIYSIWYALHPYPKPELTPSHQNFLIGIEKLRNHLKEYFNYELTLISDDEEVKQTHDDLWYTLAHQLPNLEAPSFAPESLKTESKRRPHGFGIESHDNYVISYAYFPTDYALEKGFQNEDTLFFDFHNNKQGQDFFVIVCDGVSKACLSHFASRRVAHLLHLFWRYAIDGIVQFAPSPEDNNSAIRDTYLIPALTAATYTTVYEVTKYLDNPPAQFKNSNILTILKKLNTQGGSQSTFSCVFSYNNHIYCIWMGNSPILVHRSDTSEPLLHFTDTRFQSDEARYSSTQENGMRGDVHIEVFPFDQSVSWQIGIHSDAFDEYINKEDTLYQISEITKPSERRPFNLDDTELAKCRKVDDTTIVELVYMPSITEDTPQL